MRAFARWSYPFQLKSVKDGWRPRRYHCALMTELSLRAPHLLFNESLKSYFVPINDSLRP